MSITIEDSNLGFELNYNLTSDFEKAHPFYAWISKKFLPLNHFQKRAMFDIYEFMSPLNITLD
jgi:hypothetical protein